MHSEVTICESADRIMIVNWDATDPENKKRSRDSIALNQAAADFIDCDYPTQVFDSLRDRMVLQHGEFTDGGSLE